MSYKNPISREDPNAIEKLYEKLAECERLQDTMKEVNSYEEKRSALKMRGFHWSPSEGAWQRQLNSNAIYVTDRLEFLKPLDGHRPSELQPKVNVRDKGGEAR